MASEQVEIKINVTGSERAKSELSSLKKHLQDTGEVSGKSSDELSRLGKSGTDAFIDMKGAMGLATKAAGAFGVALGTEKVVEFFKDSTKRAVDFGDSLMDVKKTTGLTGEQLNNLSSELLKVGRNTRTSNDELVNIAKIGGQLGIANDKILDFTKGINMATVALGDEFLGGAEQVTQEFGTIINQFHLGGKASENVASAITKVGSAVNALGAAGVATGPYITDFTQRVGGIAPILGVQIPKVLGLGAAMQELGQNQEVAGTSISQVFMKMGQNLDAFAGIAGMKIPQFTKLFREDANEALLRVSEGLVKNAAGADEVAKRFDNLGLDGQRVVGVLMNIGNNTELVREKQALANTEYDKGTSLLNEYNIKNEDAKAKLAKFNNSLDELKIALGDGVVPALTSGAQKASDFTNKLVDAHRETGSWVEAMDRAVPVLGKIDNGFEELKNGLSSTTFSWENFKNNITGKNVELSNNVDKTVKEMNIAFNEGFNTFEFKRRMVEAQQSTNLNGDQMKEKVLEVVRIMGGTINGMSVDQYKRTLDDAQRATDSSMREMNANVYAKIEEMGINFGTLNVFEFKRRLIDANINTAKNGTEMENTIKKVIADMGYTLNGLNVEPLKNTMNSAKNSTVGSATEMKNGVNNQVQSLVKNLSVTIPGPKIAQSVVPEPNTSFLWGAINKTYPAPKISTPTISSPSWMGVPYAMPGQRAQGGLANTPTAAGGNVVGGNSYSGDRVLMRVNSGEMILNEGQQYRLFKMLQNLGNNINFNAPINFGGQAGGMQQQNSFGQMLRNLI